MVPSMRSMLTKLKLALAAKVQINACTILYGNTRTEKAKQIRISAKQECNDTEMFSSRNIPEVNPVVMNYKIRHNKYWPAVTRPARQSCMVRPTTFSITVCGGMKNGKHGLDMRGYVQGQPQRKACSVCELVRALVNSSRLMDIATFSTRDL